MNYCFILLSVNFEISLYKKLNNERLAIYLKREIVVLTLMGWNIVELTQCNQGVWAFYLLNGFNLFPTHCVAQKEMLESQQNFGVSHSLFSTCFIHS